jgi:hypothetical protein
MQVLTSLFALLGLAGAASLQPRQAVACNNSPDLCGKSYSDITHLGAHDSPFLRDSSTDFSTSGNQFYNTTVQLNAGVRMLTAQVHNSNDQWHLCHTSCDLLDAGLLQDWLGEIKTWMDANPNDIVTVLLVNSDNASPTQLSAEFVQSGIATYAYVPPSDTTPPNGGVWPTLQDLITAKTRLMVFIASFDGEAYTPGQHYLMDEFSFIFENPFTNTNVSSFVCTPDRPTIVKGDSAAAISSGRMSLLNHFLDMSEAFGIDTPNVDAANQTNSQGNVVGDLLFTAQTCQQEYGKAPTFLLVDFFDQGPAIATVDVLNGVTGAVGRIQPPAQDTSSDRTTSTFTGVADLVAEVKAGMTPSTGAWIWAAGDWSWGGINLSGGSVLQ